MGLGFKGSTGHHHSLRENLETLTDSYPLRDGYFGIRGNSGDTSIRHIASSNPVTTSRDFYDKATYGGVESSLYDKLGNPIGAVTKLADGSVFSWREVSSSDGTPAVDINIRRSNDNCGVKTQKIHFVKEAR